MLKFRTWRYKCEFCGKNGRSAGHMRQHEIGCTMNPDRVCRCHEYAAPGTKARPVAELLVVLRENCDAEDHGLAELRLAAEECPCCILAALRQSGLVKGYCDEDGYTPPKVGKEQFDFAAEMKAVWDAEAARTVGL